jgi:hypothetical protein
MRIKKKRFNEPEKIGITIAGKIKIGEKHATKGYPMTSVYI